MLKRLLQKPFLRQLEYNFTKEKSLFIHNRNYVEYSSAQSLLFHNSPVQNRVMVASNENEYAFSVLNKFGSIGMANTRVINHEVETEEEFNKILNQNWRSASASEIVEAFTNITNFCVKNNIDISDKRFDKLVDGVMDNCEHLSQDEIENLLRCLVDMPQTGSYKSHNFHDLWSCLDDICCWKLVDWDVDSTFEIAKLWYKLNLGRLCDFIYVTIDRYTRKADKMNKNQLVNIFFCFNICRSRAVDFEYEYALENLVNEMNVDELAIVALGYFKTKTKIKLVSIMKAMIEQVIENSENVHEISLSAILKVLRFCNISKLGSEIEMMLDKLSKEIPRLSEVCCLHIGLVGTGFLQSYHPESLKKVCHKLMANISDTEKIRLKDIERILHALTLFDFDPKTTPDIFRACFEEIHKDSRLGEEIKYFRSAVCALYFLSIKNMYSYELMNRVLDKDYIEENYGKSPRILPRELLSLDCSIDIECPGYDGSRLTPNLRYRGIKWNIELLPTVDYKVTQSNELFLDVLLTVKEIVGENCILLNHVLPHFSKADIILCKDRNTNQFVEPSGFQGYILGDIMFPPKNENLHFITLTIVHWSNTIRGTSVPFGHLLMKKRQLQKIGYTPFFVVWNEFSHLTPEGKRLHILNKIKCC